MESDLLRVFVVALAGLLTIPIASSTVLQDSFHLALKNIISGPVVQSVYVSSKTQCAAACARTSDCMFYTHQIRVCQLHSDASGNTGDQRVKIYHRSSAVGTEQPENCRLLAVRQSSSLTQYRQLQLSNSTVSPYPFLRQGFVSAMLYIASIRKVLLATTYPQRIFSTYLNTFSTPVQVADVLCIHMEEDGEKGLVFLALLASFDGLYKMNTKDWDIKPVLSDRNIKIFTVSPNQQVVFFTSDHNKIMSVTYDGRNEHVVLRRQNVMPLAFDSVSDSLFYSVGNIILKYSFSNNVSTEIKSFANVPRNVYFHKGILYVNILHYVEIVSTKLPVTRKALSIGLGPRIVTCFVS